MFLANVVWRTATGMLLAEPKPRYFDYLSALLYYQIKVAQAKAAVEKKKKISGKYFQSELISNRACFRFFFQSCQD